MTEVGETERKPDRKVATKTQNLAVDILISYLMVCDITNALSFPFPSSLFLSSTE
jgi:hypothetical protein